MRFEPLIAHEGPAIQANQAESESIGYCQSSLRWSGTGVQAKRSPKQICSKEQLCTSDIEEASIVDEPVEWPLLSAPSLSKAPDGLH